jgi:hypothetical protein
VKKNDVGDALNRMMASSESVVALYCRDAELFVGNAVARLLLGKTIIGSNPQGSDAVLRVAECRPW